LTLESPVPDLAAEPTVAILTLGCGRNEVDSDQLAALLHRAGATVVDDPAAADAVLVNTCTFITPAKQESIDTVLAACQLKDAGVRAVLVVGCMAQRYPHELAEAIPEADAVVGFDGYPRLPAIVADVLAGRATPRVLGVGPADPGRRRAATPTDAATRRSLPVVVASPATPRPGTSNQATATPKTSPPGDEHAADALDRIPASGPRFPLRRHDGRPWAYLKIASGCDRTCTFCAIPSFRGRFRSRPRDEVVAEARWLVERGARELVLVSENTTSWGKDLPGGRPEQPALLRSLAQVDGVERIRLLYLQPAELTRPLLEAIAGQDKVASYFDLSLQHVAGPVVRRMGRSGDAERFGALVEQIRALDPEAVFRSNFILGFPGETDGDVDELEAFLAAYRLDWVGLFAFSPQEGTPSASLPDQLPPELAHERLDRVAATQERIADAAARGFVGRDLAVTVQERVVEGGITTTLARSYREAPDTDGEVMLVARDGTRGSTAADVPVGRSLTARVLDTVGVDLVAEVVATASSGRGRG
jgi:ribosomal protein S12 methylthiotransferase